jgi:site-specific recombinase XerD
MSDLKKLVESTNTKNVLTEDTINGCAKDLTLYIQDLNESFNTEDITEEEYYRYLEEATHEVISEMLGWGKDATATSATKVTDKETRFKNWLKRKEGSGEMTPHQVGVRAKDQRDEKGKRLALAKKMQKTG